MLRTHEPARLVGADRQHGEAERAVAFARDTEVAPLAVAGIGHVEDAAGRRLDHEARPQRAIAVEQAARRPMPHRHERHGDAGAEQHALVPVVGLRRDRGIVGAHDGVVAERRDDARAMGRGEPREGRDVEVVVVIMRDQHRVDCRQRVERDAGIVDALGPGEAER